jgi:hypothetical protein
MLKVMPSAAQAEMSEEEEADEDEAPTRAGVSG